MEEKAKKPYVKPMIIFEDFITGELTGSPEMVAQFAVEAEANNKLQDCPHSHITCL